jgi:hypothetical protein
MSATAKLEDAIHGFADVDEEDRRLYNGNLYRACYCLRCSFLIAYSKHSHVSKFYSRS